MPKTVSVYFEDEDFHREVVEKRVKPRHAGKFSPYAIELIQRDLAGALPTAEGGANVLVELARTFHPTLAAALEQQLATGNAAVKGKPVNQGRVVAKFLEALNRALEGEFDPEEAFDLKSQAAQLAELRDSRHYLHRVWKAVNLLAHKTGTPEMISLLNEPAVGVDLAPDIVQAELSKRERSESHDTTTDAGAKPSRTSRGRGAKKEKPKGRKLE